MAYVVDTIGWYTVMDKPVTLTPELAARTALEGADPRSSHYSTMRHQDIQTEHLLGRRMEMLTLAVLGPAAHAQQLAPDRARVDVRRRPGHRAGQAGGRVPGDEGAR